MGDSDRTLSQLERAEKTTKRLKKLLQRYLLETDASRLEDLEPLERAKANLYLAYMSAALLYMLLRVHGLDLSKHAVMEELQRIKERFELLNRLTGEGDRRSLVVDEEATGRILAATLTELSPEEKSKLRKKRRKRE